MKYSIAVVMGGFSSEYEVSLQSGEVVFQSLNRDQFDPWRVIISPQEWVVATDTGERLSIDRSDFSFSHQGRQIRFDAVFNAVHGSPGEDGLLASYWELLNLPQTASDTFASALTFNKAECSLLMRLKGVTTPEAVHLNPAEPWSEKEILDITGLPCFVKPSRSGSSIGVTKVKEAKQLGPAIQAAFGIDGQVIVEAMVKGREVACGVSNHTGRIAALACTDIVPQNDFFDYESKYSGLSEEITPARIDQGTYRQIMEESEFIYRTLRLNGLARVDYIVSEDGVPFFIEVNTVPGISHESILPKQAGYAGYRLGELFDQCLQHCLNLK